VLHEDYNSDCVEHSSLRFHVESSVRFAKPDQALKHPHRLAILAYPGILPQKLVIFVDNDLGFFAYDWLNDFLD
jgi:hypothetical protein